MRLLRKLSVKTAVILTVVSLILGTAFFLTRVLYRSASDMLRQLSMSRLVDQQIKARDELQTELSKVNETMEYLSRVLQAADTLDASAFTDLSQIALDLSDAVHAVLLVNPDGGIRYASHTKGLRPDASLAGTDWFVPLIADQSQPIRVSPQHVAVYDSGTRQWVLTFCRNVSYVSDGQFNSGYLLIDLKMDLIETICTGAELGEDGYLYLVDDQNNLVWHPDQPLVYHQIMTEAMLLERDTQRTSQSGLLLAQYIPAAAMQLHMMVSDRDIAIYARQFSASIISVVILVIIAAVLITMLFSWILLRPLDRLQRTMHRVETHGVTPDVLLPETGLKEYAGLSHSFNTMVNQIRVLIENAGIREKNLRDLELRTLHEQINPHFLYNTLDSIIRMQEMDRKQDVIRMTESLARLMRLSTQYDSPYFTIDQEINHVESYLAIQALRYQDHFTYQIACDPDLRSCLCPKIMLQPLVENAIKHGFSDMDDGQLHLTVSDQDGQLCLQVRDNGWGIEPKKLQRLQQAIAFEARDLQPVDEADDPRERSAGIGLINVNQRIKLLYGDPYGLTIESEVEVYTCVSIYLPKHSSASS